MDAFTTHNFLFCLLFCFYIIQVTHKEAIIQELKASLNFFQLQKPVLRNPSRAPSLAPSISPSEDESEKNDQRAALIDNFLQFEKEAQKL